jgi:hypothetical protein
MDAAFLAPNYRYNLMSELQAIHDAIKEQYGFNDWGKTLAAHHVGKMLALGTLPSLEKHNNFQLERRVELPEDRPGFRACIEYYKSTSDEGIRFAVTILQNQTVEQAHEELAEELSKCMAPSLPRAEEKNIQVGHIAFAGHGDRQTAVRFVRANLFVKVESVGPKHADVKDLAEVVDKQMLSQLGKE